jgi:regulator of PEP synthase PpsR (kinase-PPPase family)
LNFSQSCRPPFPPIPGTTMPNRTVFFISDGTGITAETFGNAILAQFEAPVRRVRLPFIDSVDKAHQAIRQINHTAEVEGKRPLVFTTVVNMDVLRVVKEHCQGMLLDMFGTFVEPMEQELASNPTTAWAVFQTPQKARPTTTGSKPSTFRWRTTTARATATCRAPT